MKKENNLILFENIEMKKDEILNYMSKCFSYKEAIIMIGLDYNKVCNYLIIGLTRDNMLLLLFLLNIY